MAVRSPPKFLGGGGRWVKKGIFGGVSPIFIPFFPDYVYFENSSSNPYLVRRIEELNKVRPPILGGSPNPRGAPPEPPVPLFQTANGNVEAKVVCLFRRRDISSSLNSLADSNARQ